MKKIVLPKWLDVFEKVQEGKNLTPIETFVYSNEPAGTKDENCFRVGLNSLIEYVQFLNSENTEGVSTVSQSDVLHDVEDCNGSRTGSEEDSETVGEGALKKITKSEKTCSCYEHLPYCDDNGKRRCENCNREWV